MYFTEGFRRMEFGSPVRHMEGSTVWFCVPLKTPHTVPGSHSVPRLESSSVSSIQETRTRLLHALLQSPRLFSAPPTLSQLDSLAPAWILPDLTLATSLRWSTSCPSGRATFQLTAVWISRSSIVPELQGTAAADCIDLEFPSPELEEVGEIAASEGMLHLRKHDVVRERDNEEVNDLWRIARHATEDAERAEEAFYKKYGEPFSEDSDSDDSDESA